MGMPVLRPGPTMRAVRPKKLRQTSSMTGVSGGTTLEMMAAETWPASSPATCMRLRRIAPYSSPVLSLSVRIFQLLTSVRPLKIPMAIVVLPTSKAKSIAPLLAGPLRAVQAENGIEDDRAGGAAAVGDQPALGVEAPADRAERPRGRGDADAPAGGKGEPRLGGRDDPLLLAPDEGIIPTVEGPAKAAEESFDRRRAAGHPDGGRRRPQLGREILGRLADVEPDADDGEAPGRAARDGFRQDAADLPAIVDEVVRPLETGPDRGLGRERVRSAQTRDERQEVR